MDPRLTAIEATHGVFLRSEVLALGYRDEHIARFVAQGEWHRVRRGAYVAGTTWQAAGEAERYRLHCAAALRQANCEVVASHTSSVAFHQGPLWGLDLSNAHLTRLDGKTGRKERGVQQHRGAVRDGDTVPKGQYRVMTATRTALEVTTIASVDASLCVMNDFLHRGLTTEERLRGRYAQMTAWPDSLRTDVVISLADGRLESVGETRTFLLCWRQGLPKPVPQLEIRDENGVLIGRVDFAWPEHGVFLEFDGREKYLKYRKPGESLEDAILREKRREELICQITGWRCIRIIWADLARPELIAARIRNLLFPGAGVA